MAELAEAPAAATAQRRFLTFRVEQQLYAVPAMDVAEVIRMPLAARVPQAPAALLGIANLRGAVLPLISLRALLGLGEVGARPAARAIVLANGPALALAVDAVGTLATVDADRASGAFQTPAGVAKILDLPALLDAAFAARARPQARAPARLVAAGTGTEIRAADAEMLVTFDVAGGEFALRLDVVEEIVPAPDTVARLPDTEDLVLGMMAFRDRLLPLLSLRGLLGIAASGAAEGREKVLVTHVGGTLVGLVADRARAIIAAARDRVDPIPPLLAARTGGEAKIGAVYRGEDGRRLISILSPDQLFREDLMRRLNQDRKAAARLDSVNGGAAQAELKFLVFRLGDDEFGLPIEAVDEVARVPDKFTRLPKTPKFLEGVVNLRGAVLPVVDQRRRFDLPKLEAGENRRLIVVRTERHRAGLIVDSVSEVLRCLAAAIDATPNLTEETNRLVHGVVNLDAAGRIVLLLDPAELLTRAEQGLLDSFAAAQAPPRS